MCNSIYTCLVSSLYSDDFECCGYDSKPHRFCVQTAKVISWTVIILAALSFAYCIALLISVAIVCDAMTNCKNAQSGELYGKFPALILFAGFICAIIFGLLGLCIYHWCKKVLNESVNKKYEVVIDYNTFQKKTTL